MREAAYLGDAARAKAELRAYRLKRCGDYLRVPRCGACGELVEGGGVLVSEYPCQARACPLCARPKATKTFHDLDDAMQGVPKVDGYEWREIELTLQRDPRDPAMHTIEALWARAAALLEMAGHLWKTRLKRDKGAALRVAIECSGSGHVHAHLLYYGPFQPKALVEAILRQVPMPPGVRAGFTWMSNARTDERGLAREVAKYQTKAPSPMSEAWIEGRSRETLHPTLAARWELATMGRHLSRIFGALRGAKPKKDEAEQAVPREPECPDHCEHCGTVGEMEMVELPAQPTVAMMHAKGMRALRGSRWKPVQDRDGPDG